MRGRTDGRYIISLASHAICCKKCLVNALERYVDIHVYQTSYAQTKHSLLLMAIDGNPWSTRNYHFLAYISCLVTQAPLGPIMRTHAFMAKFDWVSRS